MRSGVVLVVLCLLAAKVQADEIRYRVAVEDEARRRNHRIIVEMEVERAPAPLLLWMPAWTPGAYELRAWGRNVMPLSASGEHDAPLSFVRSDTDHFEVTGHAAGQTVLARYEVYAARLSDDGSQITASHAYLNGGSLFLAVSGRERTIHRVRMALPEGWRMVSALDDAATTSGLAFSSYEALIDTPIETAPSGRLRQATVSAAGAIYLIVVDGGEVPKALRAHLSAIVETEASIFGPPPYKRYLLLLHAAARGSRESALEHGASSSLVVPASMLEGVDEERLLLVVAHELIHAWNARLLRPAEQVPLDLLHPQATRSLWITEGLAEYYAHRIMRQIGLWSRARYLTELGRQLTRAVELERVGRSVEEAAGLAFTPPDDTLDPDAYYAAGHLVALALDAQLSASSHAIHPLDEIVRSLCDEARQKGAPRLLDTESLARSVEAHATPEAGAALRLLAKQRFQSRLFEDALSQMRLKMK